jgi:hypothetical protein
MSILSRIRFEDPPARTNSKPTKHERAATRLRKHPGEWARVGTYTTASSANSMAHMIRKAKAKPYAPAGSFEAVSRTVGHSYRVYARFLDTPGGEQT